MEDTDPRLSKLILAHAILTAGLDLASSVRDRGPRRAAAFFALATGLPAVGELLATGPLGLLRHRTRPRVMGVPLAVPLLWYGAIRGSYAAADRILRRLPLGEGGRRTALPPVAALVATSLDLVLDPFGLDAGLWEWNLDGAYAPEVEGANGRRGVPLLNYAGWLLIVAGASSSYPRLSGDRPAGDSGEGRLPALLLLSHYLAAAAWAIKRRRTRYLLYSAAFPAALCAGLNRRGA